MQSAPVTIRAGKKRQKSEDRLAYEEISKKKRSEMTNDELKKANERLRLEQENKRLNPSSIKKGLIFAGATAAALGTYAGIRNNGRLLISDGKNFVSKGFSLAGKGNLAFKKNIVKNELVKTLANFSRK